MDLSAVNEHGNLTKNRKGTALCSAFQTDSCTSLGPRGSTAGGCGSAHQCGTCLGTHPSSEGGGKQGGKGKGKGRGKGKKGKKSW